ncbi:hypothetical protein SASPL_120605 [Salvia splendens]|uniref:OVATE domain-containing protein n=1 Tax=Salvia splendens TaxID=180675 RepID=A0A8X8XQE9_SALSN|nr:hypothetical protein SASPL_120605 [Salvia splendens]
MHYYRFTMQNSPVSAPGEGRRRSPATRQRRRRGARCWAKESDNPYLDFRQSMLQMILEKEIYAKEELKHLLTASCTSIPLTITAPLSAPSPTSGTPSIPSPPSLSYLCIRFSQPFDIITCALSNCKLLLPCQNIFLRRTPHLGNCC